jgi:hypothetical protein
MTHQPIEEFYPGYNNYGYEPEYEGFQPYFGGPVPFYPPGAHPQVVAV